MPSLMLRARAAHWGTWIRARPPIVVLAGAWLVLIIYAFPGQMTLDSFDHLREAREGVYTDGHPPAINLLWKLVDLVIAGPFGMLALQSAGFLAGLYLVLRRLVSARRAAWLAAGVFVFPPVLMPFAVIWKDCIMAAGLVLGVAGLLSERRGHRVLALVALFGATAVRYNTLAATLPLVVLLFEWRPGMRWFVRYPIAIAAWLGVTLGAFSLNAAITDKQMHVWHSSLAVHDIVGTYRFVDRDVPDAELEAALAGTNLLVHQGIHARMHALYDPRDFLPIILDPQQPLWNLPIYGTEPAPPAQRDAIARAWADTLRAYPVAYLEHRIAVMGEVLSISARRPTGAVTMRSTPMWIEYGQKLGVSLHWSSVQRHATQLAHLIWKHTPIFVPWLYVLLSVILVPLAWRQRDVLAILLSGLGFEAALLVLAPSPDYRYSHWMVVCTIIAAIAVIARRVQARRHARPAANTQHVEASQASAQ